MAELETKIDASPSGEGASETSPASSKGNENTSATGAANTGATQEQSTAAGTQSLPFHQNPEVQKYLNSQFSKREREWDRKLQEARTQHQRELDLLRTGMSNNSQAPKSTDPQQEAALNQLADMLFGNPAMLKKYGLARMEDLNPQIEALRNSSVESAFDAELEQVVGGYATKYGMPKDDFQNELLEFIEQSPIFGKKGYSKGALDQAAKAFLFDRNQELAERAVRSKLINEQNDKKKVGTEAPSKGDKGKARSNEKSLEAFLARRVQEEGGITVD